MERKWKILMETHMERKLENEMQAGFVICSG